MPFKTVKDAIKKHPGLAKYSEKAQRGWLSAINQCFAGGGDDGTCFPIAWSVANKVDNKRLASELLRVARCLCAQKEMTPQEKANRQRKKTVGVKNLAANMSKLRRKLNDDLNSDDEKERLTALVITLMDRTAERVGNDESAAQGHLGVTGFKKKNIRVDDGRIHLEYTGKSGVKHEKEFKDARLAEMVSSLLKRAKNPGDFVFVTEDGFKVRADRVSRYLKPFGIKPKDVRGHAANRYMISSLRRRGIEPDEKGRKKRFLETLRDVAERVGHTPSMLRNEYLLPNLEDKYIKRGEIVDMKA